MSRGLKTGSFDYSPRWTKARVAEYVPGQLRLLNGVVSPTDPQFPMLDGFATKPKDQGTESAQVDFGTTCFQFGKGGLHGCTMLTIVSRRAVYMACCVSRKVYLHA